jgi:hypothetical protein
MSAFGPKQTLLAALHMSAFGGKADTDIPQKRLLSAALANEGQHETEKQNYSRRRAE